MTTSKRKRDEHRARYGHQPCPDCGRLTNSRGVCWRDDMACGWRPWGRPADRAAAAASRP